MLSAFGWFKCLNWFIFLQRGHLIWMSPLPMASSFLQVMLVQRSCIFRNPFVMCYNPTALASARLKRLTQVLSADAGADNGG